MSPYVRPRIAERVFRDADGAVIDYGNRWHDSPPEDTYSVDTHPERFAPIHVVADALITHLRETYDVEITEGAETADDLLRPAFHEVVRAVRIRPEDPTCAAVTMVFTAYPGLSLHAGVLHDFHYPICGCDACDSTWEAEVEELEKHVFAIVAGDYRETVARGPRPWIDYAFTFSGGASSGRSQAEGLPASRLRDATRILRDLPDGWAPWPRSAPAT